MSGSIPFPFELDPGSSSLLRWKATHLPLAPKRFVASVKLYRLSDSSAELATTGIEPGTLGFSGEHFTDLAAGSVEYNSFHFRDGCQMQTHSEHLVIV